MSQPIKTCKKHGILSRDDIQIEKINWKTKTGIIKEGTQFRCRICRQEKDIKWKIIHRQKHINSSSNWKKQNRDKVNAWVAEDRKNNPEKHKQWAKKSRDKIGKIRSTIDVLRIRGISMEQYENMVKENNNECQICLRPETRKSRTGELARLCIDHCHETGEVRGLLCHACNQVIGHASDSIPTLISAINYLQRYAT